MEQLILETISRHTKEKKSLRSSQHGLTKGNSCLSNLISFYNERPAWWTEGRTVDIIFLDVSKAFDIVPRKTLREKTLSMGWTGSEVGQKSAEQPDPGSCGQ